MEYSRFKCLASRKLNQNNNKEYGEGITAGDVVGVQLEFNDGKEVLAFRKMKMILEMRSAKYLLEYILS